MVRRAISGGFTLIEIAVVLAVVTLLALVALPLGPVWVDTAKVQEAKSLLSTASLKAKALALRNANNAGAGGLSAVLLISGNAVCVYGQSPTQFACGSDANWRALAGADISLDGASDSCVIFDSAGLPMSGALAGKTCSQTPTFRVAKGSYSDTGPLF